MPEDLSRRAVIGAAWAAPVIMAAVATPLAAASEVPEITMTWSPERAASRSGTLTLLIESAGPAVPSGGQPLLVTIASIDGTRGDPTLIPDGASGSWLPPDPVVPGSSATFASDGLPIGSGSVSLTYGLNGSAGAPVRFQATISRGGTVLAVSPTVAVAQPFIEFGQPSYVVDLFSGTVVTGVFAGGNPPYPLTAGAFAFSTSSFRVTEPALDPGTGEFSARLLPNGFQIGADVVTVSASGYESGSAQLFPAE